ncbi:MAG: response regulator transcription factor [Anaerolineaceae bacterium]|nr:response regulator transcription factor [Anaerolineaceae bacterium]NTV36208.1 response regulator transcription factor [Anaerolineaceae bacterium]
MTVTILLGDDHPLVHRGIRNLLETEPDFSVISEAAEDGLQVVNLADKLKPDILVVDLMMPKMNGLEVLKQVRRRSPKTRMIVLSMQSADPYVVEAFRSGAIGYVLKDSAPDELIYAIRQSLLNNKYLSPKLSDRLINELTGLTVSDIKDPYDTLTEREREIFQMAAEGKTAAEIAGIISISPRTAELHRSRMMDKLGLRSQTDLVRYAMKRGVFHLDS